jgi:alkylation response protein AidB-like acyl-CoA dehydrogenase
VDYNLTKDQKEFLKSFDKFCAEQIAPNAAAVDDSDAFPMDNWKKLAEFGFQALMIPEEFGGKGQDLICGVNAMCALSTSCASTAQAVGTSMFCSAKTLEKHASASLKKRILPAFAKGEVIGALAISEPGAGSDITAISTTAIKKDGAYVISGEKTYITNAPVADIFVVLAKTGEKFSAFAVPKGAAGLSVGKSFETMGLRGAVAADVKLDNVEVSIENLLGEEHGGLKVIFDALEYARLNISSVANGISAAAFKIAKEYSETRQAFGKPLAAHQLVAFRVTDIHVEADVARMLLNVAAWKKQIGEKCAADVAIAKIAASETAVRNTGRCLTVLAGSGFARSNPAQRLYRDAKLTEIAGGASDMLRLLIARELIAD